MVGLRQTLSGADPRSFLPKLFSSFIHKIKNKYGGPNFKERIYRLISIAKQNYYSDFYKFAKIN